VLLRTLRPLRYRGVELLDFVSLYEELAREIPLEHIDDEWLLRASTMSSRLHIRRMKRVLDVAVAVVLLLPAALLTALAAVAIKIDSSGAVLFRQPRVGLAGRKFTVLKLRTMCQDAERLTGAVWSTENDSRITRVGRILRKFRIDELPQLWNVLRGDMSLVGPRPERPEFVSQLCEQVPFYAERLLVRPGVTGWAQVMAPYAASVSDSTRKLQFDLYYVKNLSLALDLFILFKTARTVLFGRERVQGGMVAGRFDADPAEDGPVA
jgi:exopolysaccharide biosynthesis polyprenyl glycosylphosphotransferase